MRILIKNWVESPTLRIIL